ncbi:MAG: hypothetical protein A2W25_13610 [candidate division Zixibacteria bacterium RBG_16_53_22]|nr:MAG: hypothetical protein A2W25_13610 [candidate division Zixibacteria bacterium RBG_16_53_22]
MKITKHLRVQLADLVRRSSLIAMAFLLVLLAGSLSSTAIGQEEKEGAGHKEMKESKLEIPPTLPGIWTKVQDNQKELHEVLAENELAHVHLLAFAIRDYVTAMQTKSKDLTKAKQDAMAKSITRIVSLAKYLDEAGDKGDSASVATYLGKLDKELGTIEALYPAGTLKAKETEVKPKSDAKAKHDGTHSY